MRKPTVSRGRKKHKVLDKKEVAEVLALGQAGNTAYGIEKRTGINHTVVGRYLKNQEAYSDPEMDLMVQEILAKEIQDLTVLTVRARQRLHERAETMNPIEAIALMDRAFQQRRLLQGKSTENISTLVKIITEANQDLED